MPALSSMVMRANVCIYMCVSKGGKMEREKPCLNVCVCVLVCVCGLGRQKETERERQRCCVRRCDSTCVGDCVLEGVCGMCYFVLLILYWGIACHKYVLQ